MVSRMMVGLAGLALLAYAVGLVLASPLFPAAGEPVRPELVVYLVVGTVVAGLVHVAACVVAYRRPPRILVVVAVAAAARLILLFGSPGPVLEDAAVRQRFDARLVNRGVNPYEFRPRQLAGEDAEVRSWPIERQERLVAARSRMSGTDGVAHPGALPRPDLRAQAMPLQLWITSVADRFKPSSSRGLAFLALVADAFAVFLLVLALRSLGRPAGWVLVYAWSPVVLKEFHGTLRPDVFLMPVLAGLVYCLASGRRLLAAVPLALAAGLRLPLLLLAPVLGRRVGLLGLVLAALLFAGPFLPFWTDAFPAGHYFETQVHVWRNFEYGSMLENPLRGALSGLESTAENTLAVAGVELARPDQPLYVLLVKILLALMLLGLVTYLAIRNDDEREEPSFRRDATGTFALLAGLLAVSPVLHPGLAAWLLPLLAVRRFGLAWLALPVIASLTYLTHLQGPEAADLPLPFLGGALSYRLLGFGLFAVLLLVDWRLRDDLFPGQGAAASRPSRPAIDNSWSYELPEPEPVRY